MSLMIKDPYSFSVGDITALQELTRVRHEEACVLREEIRELKDIATKQKEELAGKSEEIRVLKELAQKQGNTIHELKEEKAVNTEPPFDVFELRGTANKSPEKDSNVGYLLSLPTYEKVRDALLNMRAFDTPLARRLLSGEFNDGVRKSLREALIALAKEDPEI